MYRRLILFLPVKPAVLVSISSHRFRRFYRPHSPTIYLWVLKNAMIHVFFSLGVQLEYFGSDQESQFIASAELATCLHRLLVAGRVEWQKNADFQARFNAAVGKAKPKKETMLRT